MEEIFYMDCVCSCGWNDAQSLVDTYYKPKNKEAITKVEQIPDNMIAIHFGTKCGNIKIW